MQLVSKNKINKKLKKYFNSIFSF